MKILVDPIILAFRIFRIGNQNGLNLIHARGFIFEVPINHVAALVMASSELSDSF